MPPTPRWGGSRHSCRARLGPSLQLWTRLHKRHALPTRTHLVEVDAHEVDALISDADVRRKDGAERQQDRVASVANLAAMEFALSADDCRDFRTASGTFLASSFMAVITS
eukprot:scaffold7059_cov250-Pinguiococcus_pyrenoidosus.AAC.2